MKLTLLLSILFFVSQACSTKKKEEQASLTDSLQVLKSDSTDSTDSNAERMIEYEIKNQEGFITNPFDFKLDSAELANILGPNAEIRVENYSGDEGISGYSTTTVIYEVSELSFYSYAGKHSAAIFTSLLPLNKGIQVGMSRSAFLQAMGLVETDTRNATHFNIMDDYGQMSFEFKADTLHSIFVFYEEGD